MPDPDPVDTSDEHADDDAAEAVRDFLAATLRLPIGIVRQCVSCSTIRARSPGPGRPPPTPFAASRPARRHRRGSQPVWTERSLRRRLEVASAPFSPTRTRERRSAARSTPLMTRHRCGRRDHAELGIPSTSFGRRWRSAHARRSQAPTRSRSSGCSCRPARCRSTDGPNDPGGNRHRRGGLTVLRRSMPWPRSQRPCRRRGHSSRTSAGADGRLATSNVKGSPIPMYAPVPPVARRQRNRTTARGGFRPHVAQLPGPPSTWASTPIVQR